MELQGDVLRMNALKHNELQEREKMLIETETMTEDSSRKSTQQQLALQKQIVDRGRTIEFGSNHLGGGDLPL